MFLLMFLQHIAVIRSFPQHHTAQTGTNATVVSALECCGELRSKRCVADKIAGAVGNHRAGAAEYELVR